MSKRLYFFALVSGVLLFASVAQRPVPDYGQGRRQGRPEIPELDLRAVVAREGPAEVTEGTASRAAYARRSTDAPRLYQQSGGTHRNKMFEGGMIP